MNDNQFSGHEKKYILTLRYSADVEEALTLLRSRYFPPTRNFLRAHVTLFHSLPESQMLNVFAKLSEIASQMRPFTFEVSHPYLIGGGVAFKVISEKLPLLHRELQSSWRDFLSLQDLQKRNAHITIQNKVSAAEARRTLLEVARYDEWKTTALGFDVYEYISGPWKFSRHFAFNAIDPVTAKRKLW